MPDGTRLRDCDDAGALVPPTDALRRLLEATIAVTREEDLPVSAALGRVLAASVVAPTCLPPFSQAAMDGFGFTSEDCTATQPPRLGRSIAAGDPPGPAVRAGEVVRLLTGAAIPEGVAAILMEEHAALRDEGVTALRPPRPGQHIRHRGEDIAQGAVALPVGTRLAARHIALLVALGVERVHLRARPRVALLSNGNELDGRQGLRDSNRPMLAAILAGQPAEIRDIGLLPDDLAQLAVTLRCAAEDADLILASGGISGSDADHLPGALRAAGGTVEVLHLAQKPGKPLAHGQIAGARCLFLPGNPVAALVGMLTLGLPLLHHLAGMNAQPPMLWPCRLAEDITRRPGRDEYLPVRIVGRGDDGVALVSRTGPEGSARLLPLVGADALLRVPAPIAAAPGGTGFTMLLLAGIA